MATPVVSGAAALMLQKDPTLTPDTVKARLMKTASKNFPVMSTATDPTTGETYTDYYDMFTVGAGYVDVASALTDYDQVRGSAASPQVIYNALLGTAFLVPNLAETWWSSPTWLTSMVWGPAVLVPGPAGTTAIWGSNVSWGTNVTWGTNGLLGYQRHVGHQRRLGHQHARRAVIRSAPMSQVESQFARRLASQIHVFGFITLGVATLLWAPANWHSSDPLRLVTFALATVFGSVLKLRLPGVRQHGLGRRIVHPDRDREPEPSGGARGGGRCPC